MPHLTGASGKRADDRIRLIIRVCGIVYVMFMIGRQGHRAAMRRRWGSRTGGRSAGCEAWRHGIVHAVGWQQDRFNAWATDTQRPHWCDGVIYMLDRDASPNR